MSNGPEILPSVAPVLIVGAVLIDLQALDSAAVALGAELPDVAAVLIDLQAHHSAAVAGCRAAHLVAVGIVPAVPIAGALSSGADAGRVGGVAGNSAHFPDVGAGGVGAR
ncbi:MAG: hypothetical protein NTY19_04565, partial [Planctomycetota bacterium]|nr:hypothetical protein [Planctomycetota bacterium]